MAATADDESKHAHDGPILPDGPSTSDRPDRAGADAPMAEDPDLDSTAWEGAEATDAVGLVDPRHEIPNPPGM